MNNLICYNVTCKDNFGKIYNIGTMTTDPIAAMHSAEWNLKNGSNIIATAISVEVVSKI